MNYKEGYDWGKQSLETAGVSEAELDARLLLEKICGTDRNTLLVHGDRLLSEEEKNRYQDWIQKRAQHIPLQHLTGEQEFMGLTFLVNGHVLIPRQDTEILVEEVMREMMDGSRILDMCTGSGCILLSLLHYSNDCRGTGADISQEALAVAGENARRLGIQACFLRSDLFEKIEDKYDIIVSNPPYIQTRVIDGLMDEVRLHEPLSALDGGEDGLVFYRKILEGCPEHLVRGGSLYFEIGYDQGEAVKELMEKHGFSEVRVTKDFAGLDRVVSGLWYE
ncbi:release factor glutamine methyltransferase [Lachnospiraceae bacterium NLAE-zl-G231]|nr:release factor glutamine methyltransferase [Lachnospiraceae bacterium NLAE-zl-G231]